MTLSDVLARVERLHAHVVAEAESFAAKDDGRSVHELEYVGMHFAGKIEALRDVRDLLRRAVLREDFERITESIFPSDGDSGLLD